ncbi:MAG: CbrC family protein [Candidatus Acidiferrum sp.]
MSTLLIFRDLGNSRIHGQIRTLTEFLGPMGKEELEQMGPEAIEVVRAESGHQGADWEYYFSKLDREFTATAYLFRCRHCGQLGCYSNCH